MAAGSAASQPTASPSVSAPRKERCWSSDSVARKWPLLSPRPSWDCLHALGRDGTHLTPCLDVVAAIIADFRKVSPPSPFPPDAESLVWRIAH